MSEALEMLRVAIANRDAELIKFWNEQLREEKEDEPRKKRNERPVELNV